MLAFCFEWKRLDIKHNLSLRLVPFFPIPLLFSRISRIFIYSETNETI